MLWKLARVATTFCPRFPISKPPAGTTLSISIGLNEQVFVRERMTILAVCFDFVVMAARGFPVSRINGLVGRNLANTAQPPAVLFGSKIIARKRMPVLTVRLKRVLVDALRHPVYVLRSQRSAS
jgi:hypothetical protein